MKITDSSLIDPEDEPPPKNHIPFIPDIRKRIFFDFPSVNDFYCLLRSTLI
jgi:hypothetical protein